MTPLTEIPEQRRTHARLVSNGFHFVQLTKNEGKDGGSDAQFTHYGEYSYTLYNTILAI